MWIEYRYSAPQTIGSAAVYWAADRDDRGCDLPSAWSLEWWDGSAWRPVAGVAAYPVERDRFSQVHFQPVHTAAIRLLATPRNRRPAGILEWRVSE